MKGISGNEALLQSKEKCHVSETPREENETQNSESLKTDEVDQFKEAKKLTEHLPEQKDTKTQPRYQESKGGFQELNQDFQDLNGTNNLTNLGYCQSRTNESKSVQELSENRISIDSMIKDKLKEDELKQKNLVSLEEGALATTEPDNLNTVSKLPNSEHLPAGQGDKNMSKFAQDELFETIVRPVQHVYDDKGENSKRLAEVESNFERKKNIEEESIKRNESPLNSKFLTVKPTSTNVDSPEMELNDDNSSALKNVLRSDDKEWASSESNVASKLESGHLHDNDETKVAAMPVKQQIKKNESAQIESLVNYSKTERDATLIKQSKNEALHFCSVDQSEVEVEARDSPNNGTLVYQDMTSEQTLNQRQGTLLKESSLQGNQKEETKKSFDERKLSTEKEQAFSKNELLSKQTIKNNDSQKTTNSLAVSTAASVQVPKVFFPETTKTRRFSSACSDEEASGVLESAQTREVKAVKVKRNRSFAGFSKGFNRLFGRRGKQKDKELLTKEYNTEAETKEKNVKTKAKKEKRSKSDKKEKKVKTI